MFNQTTSEQAENLATAVFSQTPNQSLEKPCLPHLYPSITISSSTLRNTKDAEIKRQCVKGFNSFYKIHFATGMRHIEFISGQISGHNKHVLLFYGSPASRTGFCSDPELFTNSMRARRWLLKHLGLKTGIIFTPVYHLDCSSDLLRLIYVNKLNTPWLNNHNCWWKSIWWWGNVSKFHSH